MRAELEKYLNECQGFLKHFQRLDLSVEAPLNQPLLMPLSNVEPLQIHNLQLLLFVGFAQRAADQLAGMTDDQAKQYHDLLLRLETVDIENLRTVIQCAKNLPQDAAALLQGLTLFDLTSTAAQQKLYETLSETYLAVSIDALSLPIDTLSRALDRLAMPMTTSEDLELIDGQEGVNNYQQYSLDLINLRLIHQVQLSEKQIERIQVEDEIEDARRQLSELEGQQQSLVGLEQTRVRPLEEQFWRSANSLRAEIYRQLQRHALGMTAANIAHNISVLEGQLREQQTKLNLQGLSADRKAEISSMITFMGRLIEQLREIDSAIQHDPTQLSEALQLNQAQINSRQEQLAALQTQHQALGQEISQQDQAFAAEEQARYGELQAMAARLQAQLESAQLLLLREKGLLELMLRCIRQADQFYQEHQDEHEQHRSSQKHAAQAQSASLTFQQMIATKLQNAERIASLSRNSQMKHQENHGAEVFRRRLTVVDLSIILDQRIIEKHFKELQNGLKQCMHAVVPAEYQFPGNFPHAAAVQAYAVSCQAEQTLLSEYLKLFADSKFFTTKGKCLAVEPICAAALTAQRLTSLEEAKQRYRKLKRAHDQLVSDPRLELAQQLFSGLGLSCDDDEIHFLLAQLQGCMDVLVEVQGIPLVNVEELALEDQLEEQQRKLDVIRLRADHEGQTLCKDLRSYVAGNYQRYLLRKQLGLEGCGSLCQRFEVFDLDQDFSDTGFPLNLCLQGDTWIKIHNFQLYLLVRIARIAARDLRTMTIEEVAQYYAFLQILTTRDLLAWFCGNSHNQQDLNPAVLVDLPELVRPLLATFTSLNDCIIRAARFQGPSFNTCQQSIDPLILALGAEVNQMTADLKRGQQVPEELAELQRAFDLRSREHSLLVFALDCLKGANTLLRVPPQQVLADYINQLNTVLQALQNKPFLQPQSSKPKVVAKAGIHNTQFEVFVGIARIVSDSDLSKITDKQAEDYLRLLEVIKTSSIETLFKPSWEMNDFPEPVQRLLEKLSPQSVMQSAQSQAPSLDLCKASIRQSIADLETQHLENPHDQHLQEKALLALLLGYLTHADKLYFRGTYPEQVRAEDERAIEDKRTQRLSVVTPLMYEQFSVEVEAYIFLVTQEYSVSQKCAPLRIEQNVLCEWGRRVAVDYQIALAEMGFRDRQAVEHRYQMLQEAYDQLALREATPALATEVFARLGVTATEDSLESRREQLAALMKALTADRGGFSLVDIRALEVRAELGKMDAGLNIETLSARVSQQGQALQAAQARYEQEQELAEQATANAEAASVETASGAAATPPAPAAASAASLLEGSVVTNPFAMFGKPQAKPQDWLTEDKDLEGNYGYKL